MFQKNAAKTDADYKEKRQSIMILRDFYKLKKHPNKNDLAVLCQVTGRQEYKISSYFAQQRFKEKRYSISNSSSSDEKD